MGAYLPPEVPLPPELDRKEPGEREIQRWTLHNSNLGGAWEYVVVLTNRRIRAFELPTRKGRLLSTREFASFGYVLGTWKTLIDRPLDETPAPTVEPISGVGVALLVGTSMCASVDAVARSTLEGIAREIEHARALRSAPIPAPAPPATVVVKEIVKIPCSYCGTLFELTEPRCPSCGAGVIGSRGGPSR